MHENRVVLDLDCHPVKAYREIPLVCSSEMEGFAMEAIRRLNTNITHKDFRARMPRYRAHDWDSQGERPLYSLSAIGMRMTRFRERAGCIAWGERAGTGNFREFIENLLPESCITANSTENFRDLTTAEINAMKAGNKGKFPERAGGRTASSKRLQSNVAPASQKAGVSETATQGLSRKRKSNTDEQSNEPNAKKRKTEGRNRELNSQNTGIPGSDLQDINRHRPDYSAASYQLPDQRDIRQPIPGYRFADQEDYGYVNADYQASGRQVLGSTHQPTSHHDFGYETARYQPIGHRDFGYGNAQPTIRQDFTHTNAEGQFAAHQDIGYGNAGSQLTGHQSFTYTDAEHQSTGHQDLGYANAGYRPDEHGQADYQSDRNCNRRDQNGAYQDSLFDSLDGGSHGGNQASGRDGGGYLSNGSQGYDSRIPPFTMARSPRLDQAAVEELFQFNENQGESQVTAPSEFNEFEALFGTESSTMNPVQDDTSLFGMGLQMASHEHQGQSQVAVPDFNEFESLFTTDSSTMNPIHDDTSLFGIGPQVTSNENQGESQVTALSDFNEFEALFGTESSTTNPVNHEDPLLSDIELQIAREIETLFGTGSPTTNPIHDEDKDTSLVSTGLQVASNENHGESHVMAPFDVNEFEALFGTESSIMNPPHDEDASLFDTGSQVASNENQGESQVMAPFDVNEFEALFGTDSSTTNPVNDVDTSLFGIGSQVAGNGHDWMPDTDLEVGAPESLWD